MVSLTAPLEIHAFSSSQDQKGLQYWISLNTISVSVSHLATKVNLSDSFIAAFTCRYL